MTDKIIVALTLDRGGQWQGTTREQNYVLSGEGICMAIPSTYDRHPFKVLVYETERNIRTIEKSG